MARRKQASASSGPLFCASSSSPFCRCTSASHQCSPDSRTAPSAWSSAASPLSSCSSWLHAPAPPPNPPRLPPPGGAPGPAGRPPLQPPLLAAMLGPPPQAARPVEQGARALHGGQTLLDLRNALLLSPLHRRRPPAGEHG